MLKIRASVADFEDGRAVQLCCVHDNAKSLSRKLKPEAQRHQSKSHWRHELPTRRQNGAVVAAGRRRESSFRWAKFARNRRSKSYMAAGLLFDVDFHRRFALSRHVRCAGKHWLPRSRNPVKARVRVASLRRVSHTFCQQDVFPCTDKLLA
jgi:hypothetical protein